MIRPIHQKVTASHLRRDAYLYVRQSTVRQVFENTESTRRQYALRERAVALGWPIERVNVIENHWTSAGTSGSCHILRVTTTLLVHFSSYFVSNILKGFRSGL